MIRPIPGEGRLRVALAMRPASLADHLFDTDATRRLMGVADVHPDVLEDLDSASARGVLADIDVLVTGWGVPRISREVVDAARNLRAVVHTGGNATSALGPGIERPLRLTNARRANSVPVAEFATAMILLAGKRVLPAARLYADRRATIDREVTFPDAGNRGRNVGIVGASTTGRLTIEMLRPFDLDLCVYDPYLSDGDARHLGVRRVGLDELMTTCSVVSVQAPEIPETRGMIGAEQLALLPDGATLINTARGSLVDTDALVAELSSRRLEAILDVTDPEPLPADHPLWALPNALLTPHVAGSMGNELTRLGATAVDEVERIAAGLEPLSAEDFPVGP